MRETYFNEEGATKESFGDVLRIACTSRIEVVKEEVASKQVVGVTVANLRKSARSMLDEF